MLSTRFSKPGGALGAVAMALLAMSDPILAAPPVGKKAAPAAPAFTLSRANLAKSASFKVTATTAPAGGAAMTRLYNIVIDGNDARVDYEDPALGAVRYLVNRQGTFLYIPANRAASKYDLKGGVDAALKQAFRFVTAQARDLTKVGTATVSGQPAVVYKNVKSGAIVYVGQRPGFRLPLKGTLKNEGGTQSFLVSEIKLGVRPSAAQFELPAGTQVIDGMSGGAAGLSGAGSSVPGSGKGG